MRTHANLVLGCCRQLFHCGVSGTPTGASVGAPFILASSSASRGRAPLALRHSSLAAPNVGFSHYSYSSVCSVFLFSFCKHSAERERETCHWTQKGSSTCLFKCALTQFYMHSQKDLEPKPVVQFCFSCVGDPVWCITNIWCHRCASTHVFHLGSAMRSLNYEGRFGP